MPDERGFLTETDRRFLQGEQTYDSKQGRYARRQAIRERTRAAFQDFRWLFHELEREEADKIFDPPEDEAEDMFEGLVKTIAFLYDNLRVPPGSIGEGEDRTVEQTFKQTLEAGVSAAERKRLAANDTGYFPFTLDNWVDVDFEVTHKELPDKDPERAMEKLAQMRVDELTDAELRDIVHRLVKNERYRLSEEIPTDHGVVELLARIKELADEEGSPWPPDNLKE